MEGLHKQGLRALSQVKFAPAPNEHELITIANSSDHQPTRASIPLHDILTKFQESSSPLPTIRLVKLHINHPPLGRAVESIVLNASKNDILRLWEQFEMDASLFHLLSKGIRGFYQHHSTAGPAISPSGPNSSTNKRTHYVICSYTYCLAWTYTHQTQTTSGVMILRPDNHLGRIDFEEWFQALEMQISIARHPLCLFLTTTMQTMHLATVGAQGAQSLINDIEWRTGFYPWTPFYRRRFLNRTTTHDEDDDDASSLERRRLIPSSHAISSNMTLDDLSLASRNIGAILVFMEDHFRQIKALQTAADVFTGAGVGIQNSSTLSTENESIKVALQLLRQQMDSAYMRLNYLRERGKNQLTVIFNLMTRVDAQASIALAKSAKKDSSSMKVIAVMTMAFLPATFLAALFAIPTLQWDATPVMQDKFWVFWAFAIPATTLVFVLWFWLAPKDGESERQVKGVWSTWSSRWKQKDTGGEGKGAMEGTEAVGAAGVSTAADLGIREDIVTQEGMSARGRGLDLSMKGLPGRLRIVDANARTGVAIV